MVVAAFTGARSQRLDKMSPYVRSLARQASAVRTQQLRQQPHLQEQTAVPLRDAVQPASVCAFVQADSERELTDNGCSVLAKFGDIYVADIPISNLATLSMQPHVRRIEARQSRMLTNDSTRSVIGTTLAHRGTGLPQAFTGDGVVLGIVDVGFDLTHPTFLDADGHVRVRRFWDFLSTDTVGSQTYVGADYRDEESIMKYAHSRDNRIINHGTHTLGTAAGAGYPRGHVSGMAPDADIVAVNNVASNNRALIDSADYAKLTSATDAMAFKYIFDYAEEVGKPCVISFSEGSYVDLSQDTRLEEAVMDSLVGPGRIFVTAAGNCGRDRTYLHKPYGQRRASSFMWAEAGYGFVNIRHDGPFTLTIRLYDGLHTALKDSIVFTDADLPADTVPLIDTLRLADSSHALAYELGANLPAYSEEQQAHYLSIETLHDLYLGHEMPVEFVLAGEGDVELLGYAFCPFVVNDRYSPTSDAIPAYNLLFPATAERTIAVGATVWKDRFVNWQGDTVFNYQGPLGGKAVFSSVGPTLDGRMKPDVIAPGVLTFSAYSSYFLEDSANVGDYDYNVERFFYNGRQYGWAADLGTSMACPAVAGSIALWLQANPRLTPEDIKDIMARTSVRHLPDMEYPNTLVGRGEIDTYHGLLDILQLTGIEGLSHHQPKGVRIGVEQGRTVLLQFDETPTADVEFRVYTSDGRLATRRSIRSASTDVRVSLAHFPAGVYAVQVDGHRPTQKGSSLVRLH